MTFTKEGTLKIEVIYKDCTDNGYRIAFMLFGNEFPIDHNFNGIIEQMNRVYPRFCISYQYEKLQCKRTFEIVDCFILSVSNQCNSSDLITYLLDNFFNEFVGTKIRNVACHDTLRKIN